ncbi:sensor domain-containing diguanylate cyclase [Luteimonas aquatica]|uniref:sensor domain-containing diguanylate cyclase n=1 Tax=Luteimonas aquatica TaxID=450364 RepID=UPI001F56BC53|nr:sensor domain-containing diguanylate cyclase [Luteimonas aquatica]
MNEAARRSGEHLNFVSRIYRMRTLGLGTGCLAVGAGLYEHGASAPVWALLVFNGYLWPVLAYFLARRSRFPLRAEKRSLMVDSMFGGLWIAMMQFNAVPSALIAVMLSADKIAVGGWRFLARTAALQALVCAVTWAALGFPFQPQGSMATLVASLPFLLAYPLALSTMSYALGRKVARQNRLLRRLSRTDALTELSNRQHWEEAAAAEMARGRRAGRPSALLMLDIDNFKQINDTYGHAFGDLVLQRVARVLRTCVRETDTAGRYGGDEFGLVLVETPAAEAREVAERIRREIAQARFGDPDFRCTASIGLAMADARLLDVAAWIESADNALYRAKQAGRNRVADAHVANPT